jgi:hypothetical protein
MKYEAVLEESSPAPTSGVSFPKKMEASVQRQVDVMKRKQWTLQWDQKSIVIREQTERIVKFIQTFSHKAALDGLEDVSSLVAKYIAIENLYVQRCQLDPKSSSNTAFESSIIRVYSSVLRFQVEAALHFTGLRWQGQRQI